MSYIQEMKEFFGPGPAFRAVSESQDIDFRAVMFAERDEPDAPFIGYMRPNPEKDFYMEISETEKREDEWIVTTPNGRWALRRLPEDQAKAFVKQLRKDGVDVD